MKKLLPLFLLLVLVEQSWAQIRNIEIDPRKYIDTAVVFMEEENYAEADQYFMSALEKIDLLPADFCFYFGKNSLLLGKFSQSIDWLNKYLELKGSRGQFSREVLSLLDAAEEGYRNSSSSGEKADINSKFFYLNTIACNDSQAIMCPICKGQDVIITRDRLGEKLYKQCPYSNNGVLTCQEYNLLIQGLLKPKH